MRNVNADRRALSPHAELLNAAAAAEIAGVSERSWHRQVSVGNAPQPVRLGRSVRWNRTKLLRWIADGCPPCRPAPQR